MRRLGNPRALTSRRYSLAASIIDMRVIAWSAKLSAGQGATQQQVEAVPKQTLLRQVDYLSIPLRLSVRTTGLFGAREFALMQPRPSRCGRAGRVRDRAAACGVKYGIRR
ncbi:hypothetical protein GCM10028792_14450 [Salinisphaera aquimarina]